MHKKRLSLVNALAWIVGSTLLISGSAYSILNIYHHKQQKKAQNPAYRIISIIQTGPEKEALKTEMLAELMQLSCDRSVNLFSFDTNLAQKRLLSFAAIKEATVSPIAPSSVYVDYTIRKPVAELYDLENSWIDEEGFLFPQSPFFAPKKLPQIYLGINSFKSPLKGKEISLALELLNLTKPLSDLFFIKRIDVSSAFIESYGRAEIVLTLEEADEIRFLRLSCKNYAQEMGNYLTLREKLQNKKCSVIDLRIEGLGFIQVAGKKEES